MSALITSTWWPSLDLWSVWVIVVALVSALACFASSWRRLRSGVIAPLFPIVGAPVLFLTVLGSELAMFVLKDGWEFGFPLRARAYPNASDFVATYIALGASYLMAREGTCMPSRSVRIFSWIEISGFVSLAGFELFLIGRRIHDA